MDKNFSIFIRSNTLYVKAENIKMGDPQYITYSIADNLSINEMDQIILLIFTDIWPIFFNKYSFEYILSICEFLDDNEREHYKLKYG